MPILDKKIKQKIFENYYKTLNDKQREAVLSYGGPLLVIAGAGSGKTTVLVNRISHLIHYGDAYLSDAPIEVTEQEVDMLEQLAKDPYLFPRGAYPPILKAFSHNPCPPDRILAITFTNKAAGEIKERLKREIGENASEIWAGTFHSVCVRLLRIFASETGYGKDFIIYDQDDCKKIIAKILKDMDIENEEITPKYLMNVISKAKNRMQSPKEFEEFNTHSEKRRICAAVYKEYQSELEKALAYDFDDLICQTVKLLKENERVLRFCQNKFQFVLVDEYQDTNEAQYLLMKLIAEGSRNVMVVGDDDQSIYKFRGAEVENILSFDKQYPDAKVIYLEQNYRSSKSIIAAANALIANNQSRRGKTLWSQNLPGLKPVVKQLEDQEKEAIYLVDDIQRLTMVKNYRYRDIAILYRTRAQANILETVFTKSSLPHRLLAGLRFYDHAEVKDVIAYLRFIHNKADFISFSRIVNVPRRGIGQTTVDRIKSLSDENGVDFYEIVKNPDNYPDLKRSSAKLTEFAHLIDSLTDFAEENSPSDLLHSIIDRTGYMETLLGDENEERRKNVDELLSSAAFFEEKYGDEANLSGFLEEIALVSDVDNYDETSDSVVMMTIHAAKGLEFPIVYIVGMEENLFPSPQSTGNESDLEEERRLAYVAMTRAKNELYLTCCHHRMIYGKTNYNDMSRFIREIPEDLLTMELYKPNTPTRTLEYNYGYQPAKIYSVQGFETRQVPPSTMGGFKKPNTTEKAEVFKAGDRVSHGIFGLGTIISAKSYAADTLYEIQFDTAGTKKLMATYAKLKKAK